MMRCGWRCHIACTYSLVTGGVLIVVSRSSATAHALAHLEDGRQALLHDELHYARQLIAAQRTEKHDQTLRRGTLDRCEDLVELVGSGYFQRLERHTERGRGALDHLEAEAHR